MEMWLLSKLPVFQAVNTWCPNFRTLTNNIIMNDFKDIKVAVAGTGYVGLSIATLLSQHHHAPTVDVTPVEGEL